MALSNGPLGGIRATMMDDYDYQAAAHQEEILHRQHEEEVGKLESQLARHKERFAREYQLIEEKRNGTHS